MEKISSASSILILGSGGYIGSSIINDLNHLGYQTSGTTRNKSKKTEMLRYLDLENIDSINNFDFSGFDIIINCIGSILYENDYRSQYLNMQINLSSVLLILSKLNLKTQHFYHLSTYVTLYPKDRQNSYSISKKTLDSIINNFSEKEDKISILKIPGVYGGNRNGGLLYAMKNKYKNKEPLTINIDETHWHIMDIHRLSDIIVNLITSGANERNINIGYPSSLDFDAIIKTYEEFYGNKIDVNYISKKTGDFSPDISIQSKYYNLSSSDFHKDLLKYLGT